MKKLYLIGNWKMNPATLEEAKKLASDISRGVKKLRARNVVVVICPPFPYLSIINYQLSIIKLGAQDVFFEDSGAYTGEISPSMLRDVGVKYVIVGHSERRRFLNETNETINKKLKAVLKNKMTPILAIGEKEKEGQGSIQEIKDQLSFALDGLKTSEVKKIIFVYEPVWAISGGDKNHKAAEPNDVLGMKIFIKKILTDLYNKRLAENVPIIYGGSSNASNVKEFVYEGEMDGGPPGSASLDAEEFIKMAQVLTGYK